VLGEVGESSLCEFGAQALRGYPDGGVGAFGVADEQCPVWGEDAGEFVEEGDRVHECHEIAVAAWNRQPRGVRV
jgi:hypothetical protein